MTPQPVFAKYRFMMKQNNITVASSLIRTADNRIKPYLEKGDFPHVTYEEYLKLLCETDDIEFRLLLEILWITGSRISEALSLRATDLIRREKTYYLNVLRLKRKNSTRDMLPIPLELGIKIEDFLRLKGVKNNAALFSISRVTVWRTLKKIGKEVLNREIHPHMFRHGRVYDLVNKGEHPFVIAKIVGHVNLQTTLGYYHPCENDIRSALSR